MGIHFERESATPLEDTLAAVERLRSHQLDFVIQTTVTRANRHEVASIHRIPVTEFLRADAPMLEHRADADHPVLRMPVGKSWIAAPTAAVLYQFRELCLLGTPTRVAHFEQPRFAWK